MGQVAGLAGAGQPSKYAGPAVKVTFTVPRFEDTTPRGRALKKVISRWFQAARGVYQSFGPVEFVYQAFSIPDNHRRKWSEEELRAKEKLERSGIHISQKEVGGPVQVNLNFNICTFEQAEVFLTKLLGVNLVKGSIQAQAGLVWTFDQLLEKLTGFYEQEGGK